MVANTKQPKRKWAEQADSVFQAESKNMLEKINGIEGDEITAVKTVTEVDTAPIQDIQLETEPCLESAQEESSEKLDVQIESKIATKKNKGQLVGFVDGKANFQGRFLSEYRTHPEFKQLAVGIPKNVHAKTIGICAENDLTLVEAVNLLIIDLVEKGTFPKDILKRYKNQ